MSTLELEHLSSLTYQSHVNTQIQIAGNSSSSYNYITFQLYLIMRIKHIFGLNIYTNFTKSKIIQYGSTSVAGLRQADVKKRIKSNVD